MEFKEFKVLFQKNFAEMTKDATHLFEIDLDMDALWNLYLDSFAPGTNPVYRKKREFDCSCCRHFIKRMGNVAVITWNTVRTVWDFTTNDSMYQPVVDALAAFVKSKAVTNVWISKDAKIGTDKSRELADGKVVEWQHFYLELPSKFVDRSGRSEGDIKGTYRDTRNVFKRSLDEISEESLLTVLELISQNSLYKGEEWKGVLTEFLKYKKEYAKLKTEEEKNNFAWEQSVKAGGAVGRIRNHSMGTLLLDVSTGVDLDEAVRKYEIIVAPTNYKRPNAIFTQKMLEDAKKTIENLGYLESLGRRYANLNDITVNNILFSNKDSAKKLGGADVFADMSGDVAVNPKKFSKVEEVSVEAFVENILPTAKEVEVLLENRHASNMVSLIAPADKDAPSLFKWGNAFGWAYSGNITDSTMKERVKSAGGKVDGALRFSIQWNDLDRDGSDLDAHCREPGMPEIYYEHKNNYATTGQLDTDIVNPQEGKPAVENITWTERNRMKSGVYSFFVHVFNYRGGKHGFRAEVEFDGQVFSFDCNRQLRQGENIQVAKVTMNKDGTFSIKESLSSSTSSREVWGIKTNQFIPVSVAMFSPNYWDQQSGIGHRHYFFMLKGCTNPENPNGFYNEFLKEELLAHKRVFEALGSKTAVKETEEQLSGVGFSSTKRNDILVKVKGQTERVIKVKF
jgi:hypothetical protein